MSYGVCSQCKREFETSADYDSHGCMRNAMNLSLEELERQLIASGKMKPKEKKK